MIPGTDSFNFYIAGFYLQEYLLEGTWTSYCSLDPNTYPANCQGLQHINEI